MERRRFVGELARSGAAALAAAVWRPLSGQTANAAPVRVLDTHIHLFDPTRPGGVPWPLPQDVIYRSSLPERYQAMAAPLGVVGAIAIEASPLASDNDWLLKVVRSSPLMVGMIGDLPPTAPNFAAELDRLRRDPLFLGIRHGNLWNRDLTTDVALPATWAALRRLQESGLVFETANPDLRLLRSVAEIAHRLPALTIVVDHLPHLEQPAGAVERRELAAVLEQLAQSSRVSVKLSEVPVLQDGRLREDAVFYRDRLQMLWSLFGADRVMFGSDWPNSDHVAPLAATFRIVQQFMSDKTRLERETFYFANSKRVYRWKARSSAQSA